jgi:hypothetical protein
MNGTVMAPIAVTRRGSVTPPARGPTSAFTNHHRNVCPHARCPCQGPCVPENETGASPAKSRAAARFQDVLVFHCQDMKSLHQTEYCILPVVDMIRI